MEMRGERSNRPALFCFPLALQPPRKDLFAVRFWSVRGFEQAGFLDSWKGSRPAPGAGNTGRAFLEAGFLRSLSLEFPALDGRDSTRRVEFYKWKIN